MMPNVLPRSDFPTWRGFAYYSIWRRFIERENAAKQFCVSEDASADDIHRQRINAGVCIPDVVLDPEEKTATLPLQQLWVSRCAFKPKQQLWVSRDSHEEDWFPYPLEIKEVTDCCTLLFTAKTTFPEDAAEGKWTLDLVHNDSQVLQWLHHLKQFAMKSDEVLHKLVIDDLLCDPAALRAALLPPGVTPCRTEVQEAAAFHGLNDRQTEALWQVFQHRCSLIQGPPGTGKTRTATAIASLNESRKRVTLLTSVTNLAVDNLARTVVRSMATGIARVVSQSYDDELKHRQDTRRDLHEMLYPEMVRRYLDSQDYQRDSRNYNRHIKKHAETVLKSKEIRTFAATCHVIGAQPEFRNAGNELVSIFGHFGQSGLMILMDEAAQATEPEVLQLFDCGNELTCIHQIGDHRQLPATVSHPANRADSNDISMFERLLCAGILPCIILQEQWRMQEPIADYPSSQFYNDKLITMTPRLYTNPEGFDWPGRDPVAFINVDSVEGEHAGNHGRGSLFNTAEARLVADLVQNFITVGKARPSSIGVVTTYSEQVRCIEGELRKRTLQVACVSTIDKAQGSEYDLIIVSFVRSNPNGVLGFVADSRRLNVAMTRAKRGLILIGDYATLVLKDTNNTWKPFFDYFYDKKVAVWRLLWQRFRDRESKDRGHRSRRAQESSCHCWVSNVARLPFHTKRCG